jgi:hypothetical protein
MAKVAIAHIAFYLNARHAVTIVFGIFDYVGFNRFGKTWPTTFRFEFRTRVEEYGSTTAAGIDTRLVSFTVLSAKCSLGSFLSANLKFFGS